MNKPSIGPFLVWVGLLVALWGTISWFLPFEEGDAFYTDLASNLFYTLLGLLIAWSGWIWAEGMRHDWATWVGAGLVLLAIIGAVVSVRDAPNLWVANLDMTENVINLALGLVLVLGGRRVITDEAFLGPREFRGYRYGPHP